MLSKNPTLVLVLGFIVGCGAAVIAPQVIPPAHAQTTQRWETYCASVSENRPTQMVDALNATCSAAGAQGWELVSVSTEGGIFSVACFKRPAP